MDNNANAAVAEGKKVRLRVLTPMHTAYDGDVDMVIVRTTEGEMGILRGHDNRAALLGDGVIRIFEDAKQGREDAKLLMVLGGVFMVGDDGGGATEVTVTSEIAEQPDKMQERLRQLEAERRESEILDQDAELFTKRMEMALRRALVNLEFDDSLYEKL